MDLDKFAKINVIKLVYKKSDLLTDILNVNLSSLNYNFLSNLEIKYGKKTQGLNHNILIYSVK